MMATSVSVMGLGVSGIRSWAPCRAGRKDSSFLKKKKQKDFYSFALREGAFLILDEAGVESLARRIAGRLEAGDLVLLDGPLGAGKSTLARALIRTVCGAPDMDVPSPSYTLVQSYETPAFTLHHFDLWRLDGPDSLVELGWDEARRGAVVVEWPDRLGDLRPADALCISIALDGPETRVVSVTGWGARLQVQAPDGPVNLAE
jgi:tRNA threonylcarbamoyladenosine biosynthesis protein TsaE